MKYIVIPFVTLCLGLLPATSTDPVVQQTAQAKFEQALKWLQSGDIHIRGRLSDEAKGGMSGNMIIMGGGPSGEKFKGSFYGQLDAEANLWVISKNKFPGFSMKLGEAPVFQMTYDRNPFDLGSMADQLSAMMSTKRLKKYGSKTKWAATQNEQGGWVLEGEISKKLVPKKGGMMSMEAPVKSITMKITLDPKGAVTDMEMHMVQGDPLAGLMAKMGEGGGVGSFELNSDQIAEGGSPFGDVDAEDMPDGSTTVYKLKLSKKPAEKRIVAFQKYCNGMSVEEDF